SVDLQGFVDTDSLVGSPRFTAPSGSRHHTLNSHQWREWARAEVRSRCGMNTGVEKRTERHAARHEVFAIEMELIGVVVRVGREQCGTSSELFHTSNKIGVDNGALGVLRWGVWTGKQPLRAFDRREHHVDGDVPIRVAVDLDSGAVHAL